MPEITLFVDASEEGKNTVVICKSNATNLGVKDGDSVEVFNPENNLKKISKIKISDKILDFAGQFSKDILNDLNFNGLELILRPTGSSATLQPVVKLPKVIPPKPTPRSIPTGSPTSPPLPQPSISPTPALGSPSSIPSIAPQPPKHIISTPTPPPKIQPTPPPTQSFSPIPHPPSSSQPTHIPQSIPSPQPQYSTTPSPSQMSSMGSSGVQVEQFPNKTNVKSLQKLKNGIILTPKIDSSIQGGRVKLNTSIIQKLGLGQGMLIAWEDPLSRAIGSARIDGATIDSTEIRMSKDTYEDTNIHSDQIVIFSTEPAIVKASSIMLEVEARPNLVGHIIVNPRTQHTLSLQPQDIIGFEDELTGAMGAGRVDIAESVADNRIVIDSEILEASGIGSFEVKVFKNQRTIITLQSISLGISPISGENMWEIISTARENIGSLKDWISNYIIFKGIKLRWSAVNIACSILETIPDLTGDIFASVSPNTTISLTPVGLVPFNAILIIDISRSMMARDVLVKNIGPAIEGIKAAMESREIQEFLKHFREGINIPRRISAAFAAILFLSEKVGRGFGEKVSVIRFADEAQLLPFGNSYYMDSASGKKDVLEDAARMIVDRIGNVYGQATNMGAAMIQAHGVLNKFQEMNPDQPTMIVLLTDGIPTDGEAFFDEIRKFAENVNTVVYIVGLGNADDELMDRAAALCGGEYYKPNDAGELLIWYSKRARDLTVKLKAHKK